MQAMSAVECRPSTYARMAAARTAAEQAVLSEGHAGEGAASLCEDVQRRLSQLGVGGVPSTAGERRAVCGVATCISLSEEGPSPSQCARLCQAMALLHNYRQPFTVVLALKSQPKVLAHGRPLTRRDINSGATYQDERLVLMWRWDPDFWKVLLHELTHLMAGTSDEAGTEARALDLHCALRASSEADYAARVRAQRERLRLLSARVGRTDVGDTNASLYWQQGSCLFEGGGAGCYALAAPHAPPSEQPDETFTVTM